MKKLGFTEGGGAIVELTHDELGALQRLALVTEGKALWDIKADYHNLTIYPDLATVIGAVHAFVNTKGLVNALYQVVEQFDKALTLKKEKTDD